MAIFLDSAQLEEARTAFSLGFVYGVTTNPRLIFQAGGLPEDTIYGLCTLTPGPVLYQLTAPAFNEKMEEAHRMVRIHPHKVVLKIPCTTENLSLMTHLVHRQRISCAATAVFSAAQAYLACEAGAKYIIPYVNRITAGGGDGPGFVGRIAAIAKSVGKGTEVLAASLKTPEEAAQAIAAGAHHVTLPLALIQALGNDPMSDEVIKKFSEARG